MLLQMGASASLQIRAADWVGLAADEEGLFWPQASLSATQRFGHFWGEERTFRAGARSVLIDPHRVISPPSIDAVRKGHFAEGRYGTFAITGSISLDAGELDDLAPFLGFVSDELAELFRRHRPGLNA